uniref:DMAP1-binding domain-containing protein n=1 Tax=Panagrolaimus davidi TaxID=227884 RepID=A0A914QYV0_9BILA
MHDPPEVDISKLPAEVREQLAQLELELSEGDITEKGFKKKRDKLLQPYLGNKKIEKVNGADSSSPSTNAQRRRQRRLTRNESRYHSEIRQEAVLQALAQKSEKESKYVALQPMRRKKDGTSSRRPSIQNNISDCSCQDLQL